MSEEPRRCRWVVMALVLVGAIAAIQMGVAAVTSGDVFRVAQTFTRLAALDPETAVDVWFSPATKNAWDRTVGDAFSDPVRAAAFFSSTAWFVAQPAGDAWILGLYNPWVSELLVFELPAVADRVTGFSLVSVAVDPVPAAGGAAFERALLVRMATGAQAFDGIAKGWSSQHLPGATAADWAALKAELDAYKSALRDELAPEGSANLSGLRSNLADVLSRLAGNTVGTGLAAAETLDLDWRQSLAPVWATLDGATAQVALGSPRDPFTILWLRLSTDTGGEPVQDARVIDVVARLKAAQGGTQ